MNKEILFRGQRLDNGEWVYGSLVQMLIDGRIASCICPIEEVGRGNKDVPPMGILYTLNENLFIVNPDTIGQYTGLCDKNGNKIFEDDIIKHITSSFYGIVTWNSHGYFYIKEPSTNDTERDCTSIGYMLEREDFEIIGNIHSDPLKGGKG